MFLDLTEAFYRTLRPLAVGGQMSDQCLAAMCHRLHLDQDALHDLHRMLSEPSAIEEAQAPPHVRKMLQAFHSDTWFQLGQQEDLVRTEIGSRPGDSFADVIFGLLWSKLLKRLENTLVEHHILDVIPDIDLLNPFVQVSTADASSIPLLGPTWMDDLNFFGIQQRATGIAKTKFAISVLLDSCLDF